MKKSRFSDNQIITILKQNEQGVAVLQLCREHGINGGMDAFLMKEMKELRTENARLKKMYAEEKLKAGIAREAIEKKW